MIARGRVTNPDPIRRYVLLAEHHQLCEEVRDLYGQARKDDDATFAAWVNEFVPEPLREAVWRTRRGLTIEDTIWGILSVSST